MKHASFLSAFFLTLTVAFGCGNKNEYKLPDWPWEDPAPADTVEKTDPAGPEDPSSTEWTDVSSDYSGLPEYVKIFKAPAKLCGRNAVAFIAEVDLSKQSFNVWGIKDVGTQGCSESLQTPSQVYAAKGNPSVVINGGYFYSYDGQNYAASLAADDGKLLSTNINYASKDWVTYYYPTRAVFLEHADGTFEAAWSYYSTTGSHWVYQQPAENSYASKPLQVPSATFPSKGEKFEAVNGIGGGPVLLKGGEIKNTYIEEMYDEGGINPTSPNNPRTAIGITADKHLVLFVCEGRDQTPDVPGFTTQELANILKDYGCTDAINLDGGGSTMMLVCGKELIKPSDGKQRSVGSCVYVK
ncbi:MAG: phosphodiester glycosidase family protein [Bacteroidales bacterium]|nr:phosphodiester glycosidase family protein [Bacteroidales bacterium]